MNLGATSDVLVDGADQMILQCPTLSIMLPSVETRFLGIMQHKAMYAHRLFQISAWTIRNRGKS